MREIAELSRLKSADENVTPWKKWGPYLSERQWGTVREDFGSADDAWDYFPHDHSRSRAYRMGEDGIAGISDDNQQLCFAVAFWNGKDAILKERLFGLSNREGNHGEDVKEYYFYLDNTPTHSYMKYLYKYPQEAFPYELLVTTNRQRTRHEPEYELLDAGAFDEDRYFDIFIEYAKSTPEDILIRITAHNRGPAAAPLYVLPTLWFRNTWAWSAESIKPAVAHLEIGACRGMAATHWNLGTFHLYCDGEPELLFTENETNSERLFHIPNRSRWVKDAFHDYVIHGRKDAVNPSRSGTKSCALYRMSVENGDSAQVRLRLTHFNPEDLVERGGLPFGESFDAIMSARAHEADEFYESLTTGRGRTEAHRLIRQALAGLLWNKQYYYFDVSEWVKQHRCEPGASWIGRPKYEDWSHMLNGDIIAMADKWEYPWYSSWDLPFNALALCWIDPQFAKKQIELLLGPTYLNPNGQIPACEADLNAVMPPVHAWAALFIYNREKFLAGEGDVGFLKRVFRNLMLNFTWWANRRDRYGRNVFEGGFLGVDSTSVFDRSRPLPTGGYIEETDGVAWCALFCQNMLEIAVELASLDPSYQELAVKFHEHMMWMACTVNGVNGEGLWDEEDGFYYDRLRWPDGTTTRLKVRSLDGLIPLCATTVVEKLQRERSPLLMMHLRRRFKQSPHLASAMHPTGPGNFGVADRGILGLVDQTRLRRILRRLLDENEFLSPFGVRSLSRFHAEQPYTFSFHGDEYRVAYVPGESDSALFGGNANWRGPVWFPVNVMIIRALLNFYMYYGDSFRIECPTGSNQFMNLFEVGQEIVRRLSRIFIPQRDGRRPVYGSASKFQNDPHWRDYICFYEYFHGDSGAGLGASHQTGWTALIAGLIHLFSQLDARLLLDSGKAAAYRI